MRESTERQFAHLGEMRERAASCLYVQRQWSLFILADPLFTRAAAREISVYSDRLVSLPWRGKVGKKTVDREHGEHESA